MSTIKRYGLYTEGEAVVFNNNLVATISAMGIEYINEYGDKALLSFNRTVNNEKVTSSTPKKRIELLQKKIDAVVVEKRKNVFSKRSSLQCDALIFKIDSYNFLRIEDNGLLRLENHSASYPVVSDNENFIMHTELSLRDDLKISADKIRKEGFQCIISLYVSSEITGGDFADDLVENMEDTFAFPLDIPATFGAIQAFREWDFDSEEAEESNVFQINAEVKMVDTNLGYKENEFSDYMYKNGEYVPHGIRVGLEINDELKLDKGIFIAHTDRTEDSVISKLRYKLSSLGVNDLEIEELCA